MDTGRSWNAFVDWHVAGYSGADWASGDNASTDLRSCSKGHHPDCRVPSHVSHPNATNTREEQLRYRTLSSGVFACSVSCERNFVLRREHFLFRIRDTPTVVAFASFSHHGWAATVMERVRLECVLQCLGSVQECVFFLRGRGVLPRHLRGGCGAQRTDVLALVMRFGVQLLLKRGATGPSSINPLSNKNTAYWSPIPCPREARRALRFAHSRSAMHGGGFVTAPGTTWSLLGQVD